MKKINIYILLLSLFLFSCYKDKGNYVYEDLPEVILSTDKDTVYVTQFDTLFISINAYLDGNKESDYDFSWRLWSNDIGNTTKKSFPDTKDFEYKVTEVPGSYTLVLSCQNRETKVNTYKSVQMRVQGVISEGWLVLNEKNGQTDFDLIMTPFFSTRYEKDIILKNLYEEVNGEKLNDRGVKISNYFAIGRYQYVVVVTESGGVRLNASTMQKTYDFSTLMLDGKPLKPENYFYISYYWALGRGNEILISDGRYYINELLGSGFTEAILKDGETYKSSKYGAKWMWTFKGMIYDELKGRFLSVEAPLLTATKLPEAKGRLFDWNNLNGELRYIETGFNFYEYALIKDWDTGAYNLYVLNFDEKNDFDVALYSAEKCEKIDDAKYFSIGERGNVFYYSTESDIYIYDYAGSNASRKVYSVNNNERITGVKILKPYVDRFVTNHPYNNKVLVIATYNDSNQEGKVLMYYINESNGDIDFSSKKEFGGFGEILDMDYNFPIYGS